MKYGSVDLAKGGIIMNSATASAFSFALQSCGSRFRFQISADPKISHQLALYTEGYSDQSFIDVSIP
jgi:hypothetical protein